MTARLIMKLRVEKMRFTTPDVLHMQLVHPLRPALPEWSAGAHVDLRMPDGRVRQYSLCGDPDDSSKYEIAIKREAAGRGASIWTHENIREGSEVHISAPRNNLPLSAKGERYILIAGGIGVRMASAQQAPGCAAQPYAEAQVPGVSRTPCVAVVAEDIRHLKLCSQLPRRIKPAVRRPCSGVQAGSELAGSC